jgi:hypothetical protein
MSTMEAHQQFGKDLEPIIVSGSNRWEIFRVREVLLSGECNSTQIV